MKWGRGGWGSERSVPQWGQGWWQALPPNPNPLPKVGSQTQLPSALHPLKLGPRAKKSIGTVAV